MSMRVRETLRSVAVVLSVSFAVASTTGADEILLRGGGRVSGIIVQRTERTVTVETSPGLLTLPASSVERILGTHSNLETWREKSSALSPRDVAGWVALARWAEENDMYTQARTAWLTVLAANPRHPEANDALGRVQHAGTWMPREQAYRAQGLIPFEGQWLTRAEYEAALQERAAEQTAALERREAALRLREAEARLREVEARAASAEAMLAAPPPLYDAPPVWWGGWGGFGFDPFFDRRFSRDPYAALDPLPATTAHARAFDRFRAAPPRGPANVVPRSSLAGPSAGPKRLNAVSLTGGSVPADVVQGAPAP